MNILVKFAGPFAAILQFMDLPVKINQSELILLHEAITFRKNSPGSFLHVLFGLNSYGLPGLKQRIKAYYHENRAVT